MPFNVWPAPSARAFSRASLISLRQRIRSRGAAPAKMEIRAFRSSQSTAASSAIERHRVPEHRSTVRPSRFHHPQTSSATHARLAPATDLVRYGAAAAPASKPRPARSTAQATRASLAASATTTAFLCARRSGPRRHRPSAVSVLDSALSAARAPRTGILRRQASPRLPIPSGFALDLRCRHSTAAVSGAPRPSSWRGCAKRAVPLWAAQAADAARDRAGVDYPRESTPGPPPI